MAQDSVSSIRKRQTSDMLPLSEETMVQILDVQRKEFEFKTKELEQRKREDEHSFEFAKKTLDAQIEDRREERIKFGERLKVRYFFICVVLLMVLIFLGYALSLGMGELVARVIEKVAYYASGVLSSYGYVKFRESRKREKK